MRLHNYAETCKGIWSSGLGYNFLIQLFTLKSLVFVVHCLNAFWQGNETFPKGSSLNEIFPLLVVFHLPYSKYKGVKICFYSCLYENQNFSLVSHWCRSCSTRVALLSLVQHSCWIRVARAWHSCCKLEQISFILKIQDLSLLIQTTRN